VTLEEIIIEESHNLSFPHGRNLRSIAFHVRKLEDWAKQLENENDTFKKRIKRLEKALESIREYWNRDNNEGAMNDACWHAINTASEALEAKEAKL